MVIGMITFFSMPFCSVPGPPVLPALSMLEPAEPLCGPFWRHDSVRQSFGVDITDTLCTEHAHTSLACGSSPVVIAGIFGGVTQSFPFAEQLFPDRAGSLCRSFFLVQGPSQVS